MSQIVLELKGISKTFPGVKALNEMQLQVYAGEVHALMGENGAGKSTLMNIINGSYQKDSGEIYMDGRLVEIRSINDAAAAWYFDDPSGAELRAGAYRSG